MATKVPHAEPSVGSVTAVRRAGVICIERKRDHEQDDRVKENEVNELERGAPCASNGRERDDTSEKKSSCFFLFD